MEVLAERVFLDHVDAVLDRKGNRGRRYRRSRFGRQLSQDFANAGQASRFGRYGSSYGAVLRLHDLEKLSRHELPRVPLMSISNDIPTPTRRFTKYPPQ